MAQAIKAGDHVIRRTDVATAVMEQSTARRLRKRRLVAEAVGGSG